MIDPCMLTEAERVIVFRALGTWFNLRSMEGAPEEECAQIMRLMQRFSGAPVRPDA